MSIITISRGSFSRGEMVARKVAEKLGYECIGREVLLEASKEFNIPEIKLVRAIHDAPSILDRSFFGKEKYMAYIQAALLRYLKKDNVVYHGLAGHFFVKGISHALKVRIIADLEDRVKWEMEREGTSEEEALLLLKMDDKERRRWSKCLYGIDTADPSLYDLVIHIGKITVAEAADIITQTVGLNGFQTTAESQRAIDDLALSAEVKASLVKVKLDIEVSAQNGIVCVQAMTSEAEDPKLMQDIKRIAKGISGVKEVRVQVGILC
jgi:cytidylate kinase